jgi:hypothetical protein
MLGAPIGAIGGEVPWWDPEEEGLCVWGAWQAVGVASFAASLLDLSGNGNNLGDPGGGGTPGWNAIDGWICNGIGNYLTGTFVCQNDQSQSIIVQYSGVTNAGQLCGAHQGGANDFGLFPNVAANVRYYNGNVVLSPPVLLTGNLAIAGNQGYRNGVPDGGAIGGYAGVPVQAVYLGCINNAGVPASFCAVNIRACAIYECTLTAAQVLAIATAAAALPG